MSNDASVPPAELIRWPEEAQRLDELRAAGIPRLLLIGPDATPPNPTDLLEDWARLPADANELRDRVARLAVSAASRPQAPWLDNGMLRFGGKFVLLSPIEERLAQVLLAHRGSVASSDALIHAAWPEGASSGTTLRVHVGRLRRRVAALGLGIRVVNRRGYLLEVPSSAPNP